MIRSLRILTLSCTALTVATGLALAQQLTVTVNRITEAGVGDKIGTVVVAQSKYGTTFNVAVTGLPQGPRGFHVHEKGDCGPATKDGKMTAGDAAGAHYDPEQKKSHKGPTGAGHKGDLPVLNGTDKGISQTVTAPQLKLADLKGRALVIHEGGDNYSDQPKHGGGKGRVACSVVPNQ